MTLSLERSMSALEFRSGLSLAQMKQALEEAGKRPWHFGDSEWHGDYLGGSLSPQTVLRIYAMKGCYRAVLRFVSETGDARAWEKFMGAQKLLLQTILPLIHAESIQPAEPLG